MDNNTEQYYKIKYQKYKIKYLNLLEEINGGGGKGSSGRKGIKSPQKKKI